MGDCMCCGDYIWHDDCARGNCVWCGNGDVEEVTGLGCRGPGSKSDCGVQGAHLSRESFSEGPTALSLDLFALLLMRKVCLSRLCA